MRKKIKNLTLNEIKKICYHSQCFNCPFDKQCVLLYGFRQLNVDMEKEVEVQE